MYEFPTPEPITVAARLRSGRINVTAEECDTTTVEVAPHDKTEASREAAENTRVELGGDGTLLIEAPESGGRFWRRGGAIRVTARVPIDSTLDLKLMSADVHAPGRWRKASIHSASGDVAVDHITGDLNVNTASGNIRADRVGGTLHAQSASGDISIGTVDGDASIHAASGDVQVDDAGASVNARTASGNIDIGNSRRGEVRAQSASGDVRIAVAPGTGVYLDVSTVSGTTHSDLAMGDTPGESKGADLTISARTVSGDIAVLRAHQKASA